MPENPFYPKRHIMPSASSLCLLVAQDVRVASVQDGKGGATEELSAGSAKLNLSRSGQPNEPSKVCATSSLGSIARTEFSLSKASAFDKDLSDALRPS